MPLEPTFWNEDRKAHAKKLFADGRSAAQIAAAIGGTSRNGVLGMMHRNREKFPVVIGGGRSTQLVRAARVAKGGASKAKVAAPAEERPEKPVVLKRSVRMAEFGLPAHRPQPTSGNPFPHRGASLEGGAPKGVAFGKLSSRQCAWPLVDFRDPDGPEMPCCGLPRRGDDQPDSAYCSGHAAIARGTR